MSISNYLETRVLDAVLNNTSLAIASVYAKLHTGDPGEDGTALAASNTQRQGPLSFGSASGNLCSNDVAITWTSVSASETYGGISLWDNSTAGNCLWTGTLTTPKAVNSGDTFTIAIGDLDITVD